MDEIWVLADKKDEFWGVSPDVCSIPVFQSEEKALSAQKFYHLDNYTPKLLFSKEEFDELKTEVYYLTKDVRDIQEHIRYSD